MILHHIEKFNLDSDDPLISHRVDKSNSAITLCTEPNEELKCDMKNEEPSNVCQTLSASEHDLLNSEDLKIENLIDMVEEFNGIYDISPITDQDLINIRKAAIKKVLEFEKVPEDTEENMKKIKSIKQYLKLNEGKYNDDIKVIKQKMSKMQQSVSLETKQLVGLESNLVYCIIYIGNYQFYLQTFDHLQEKIEILRQTQVMINKEIWKKKQILKIMHTNKSFSKAKSRNNTAASSNTFDAGLYSYGRGLCYTEEVEPQDDFMYERRKSNANNTSLNTSQRGLAITETMAKKTIQEEALEIEKLRIDVENIEEKIQVESECFELYYSKYEEAKILYEDKKGTIDDLNEFMN